MVAGERGLTGNIGSFRYIEITRVPPGLRASELFSGEAPATNSGAVKVPFLTEGPVTASLTVFFLWENSSYV
jgi:hypothetical protein